MIAKSDKRSMESARPNALRSFVIIAVAFSVGYLIANPAGTVWRARYWLPFGDRNSALERLVEVEPGGAESELTHAIETDDPALQLTAAEETIAVQRGTLGAEVDTAHLTNTQGAVVDIIRIEVIGIAGTG